ncbi:uncharacterized protein LOC103508157 [Diaphorina citri]|uniref:Uncharacterized protein LOC103508157 n=1 Tax=Diaphorina citri TaxID=121845 RepID=A0A1S3CZD5_DIACI|nr:uncharacterized protein LOC103508157 [Diaphorina citri]
MNYSKVMSSKYLTNGLRNLKVTVPTAVVSGGNLTNGLRNLKVTVPTAVVSGGSCILECTYDLEGDLLYSVKWFRGKTEFYRFVPKEIPPTRTFASSGITVDLNNSTDTRVSIINMQRELSDYYRCEVVTDIPKFYTAVGSSYLVVVGKTCREN